MEMEKITTHAEGKKEIEERSGLVEEAKTKGTMSLLI